MVVVIFSIEFDVHTEYKLLIVSMRVFQTMFDCVSKFIRLKRWLYEMLLGASAMATISLEFQQDDVTLEIRFIIKTQGSQTVWSIEIISSHKRDLEWMIWSADHWLITVYYCFQVVFSSLMITARPNGWKMCLKLTQTFVIPKNYVIYSNRNQSS